MTLFAPGELEYHAPAPTPVGGRIAEIVGERVLVRRDLPRATSPGGLHLGHLYDNKRPNTGVVVAVGRGADGVAAGDRVVFRRHSGQTFEVEGEALLLIPYVEVFAVLEP